MLPFGTSLDITPTLLRSQDADGTPRVRVVVKAGRRSILSLQSPEAKATGDTVYDNVSVTSEAVLNLNQTLILTGLSQRERRESRSGIPGLKSIPIIKYLFSENIAITSDVAIIILLTPRDPAYWDQQNQQALAEFVEKRRAYVQAWRVTRRTCSASRSTTRTGASLHPTGLPSHFFLMDNSEVYRRASGIDLANENLEFDLLGKMPKSKAKL